MADQLYKLQPDRDLQCYFQQPSAVAALSATSPAGFTVSGCWRQQFDWAVVEWNRDNVFEHPALRNLPDGDLSGLHVSYDEARVNCVPLDSILYSTVDWPYLRIWADPGTGEQIYWVPLREHATAVGGSYVPAAATFGLGGTAALNDYVELACDGEHFTHQFYFNGEGPAEAIANLVAAVNNGNPPSQNFTASGNGASITLTYKDPGAGANTNRVGVYGNATGAATWTPSWQLFSGGQSPAQWHIDLDFSNLQGYLTSHPAPNAAKVKVPTNAVRKMRWTWAADLQAENFQRSEFSVLVTNWTVTGANLLYSVAGPGSRRIEDSALDTVSYTGGWTEARGNYSDGSIHLTHEAGASLQCSYTAGAQHTLYLGTRRADGCGAITVQVDANPPVQLNLSLSGEDVLVRVRLGEFAGGVQHSVTITTSGTTGGTASYFYFDFLEIAVPIAQLPVFDTIPTTTLATDWDTEHSLALAPERTAWLIHTLGFQGRANHYAGALWFYELSQSGQQYASATITFAGAPEFFQNNHTQMSIGEALFQHSHLIGDTAQSIARCFALLINEGSTGVWASVDGAKLTITARTPGTAGNGLNISASTQGTQFTATPGATLPPGELSGGRDGKWLTDLAATPRLNRAARDWSSSYFKAMSRYGLGVAAAFSMELGNGDDTTAAGIAQRYPNGDPAWVNTPALQTNFSPSSTAFWKQVYLDMAAVMVEAGVAPYLQFGEVQWWYFCPPADPANGNWKPVLNGGMPLYDAYTTSTFQSQYGRAMHVFTDPSNDPAPYPSESAFLPALIGEFTQTIMAFVHQTHPDTRFEVLYPPDVNDAALNRIVNLPAAYWTPANLTCLKTENFTYTGDRDLNKARASIELPMQLGFSPSQSSHLVGIGDYTTPWAKEQLLALGESLDSVVLFALDQFCLIGYPLPLDRGPRRAQFMGG
jgi:hypothetical protein